MQFVDFLLINNRFKTTESAPGSVEPGEFRARSRTQRRHGVSSERADGVKFEAPCGERFVPAELFRASGTGHHCRMC